METVTDSLGRVLEVKKPTGREIMKLMRTCGSAWDVQAYQMNALFASCVVSIDGVPVPRPQNVDQVDALPEKVGPEGMDAVQAWAMAITPIPAETVVADAKN